MAKPTLALNPTPIQAQPPIPNPTNTVNKLSLQEKDALLKAYTATFVNLSSAEAKQSIAKFKDSLELADFSATSSKDPSFRFKFLMQERASYLRKYQPKALTTFANAVAGTNANPKRVNFGIAEVVGLVSKGADTTPAQPPVGNEPPKTGSKANNNVTNAAMQQLLSANLSSASQMLSTLLPNKSEEQVTALNQKINDFKEAIASEKFLADFDAYAKKHQLPALQTLIDGELHKLTSAVATYLSLPEGSEHVRVLGVLNSMSSSIKAAFANQSP